MSLYNMTFGYNPATILLAPMIAAEDPREFFPRFRDCYAEDGRIVVYTRVGGGNRTYGMHPPHDCMYDDDCPEMEWSFHEDRLYALPTFDETWDDEFDSTYGYYAFRVPDEFKADFDAIMEGDPSKLSDAYLERITETFGEGVDVRGAIDPDMVDRLRKAPDWEGFLAGLRDSLGES